MAVVAVVVAAAVVAVVTVVEMLRITLSSGVSINTILF